ncbi:NfeD family protein [Acidicapsa dinghuensis]|uniref:NfeD family protein n=1 Tax=Acidicapsa dinghuensis TaxID=2218256 RepID=A0ABW1EBU9_9BACT|nr:NfeD family protein [Acidicapsa dinghuensis]
MIALFPVFGMTTISMVGDGMGFWEGFYFACFIAGLLLSMISLIGGMGHISWHFHMPRAPVVGHVPHVTHIPVAGRMAPGAHTPAIGGAARASATVPWWNAFSIMVFLCWFGAAGYLLTRYGTFVTGVVFVLAALCGLIGGAVVFWFLTRVLLPHERELTAEDTSVMGVVGKVSSTIRAGGTGEVLYEQMGATRSVPARADLGEPIERGEEVFVVRYEQGIAYVRRWEELVEMHQ